MYNSANAYKNIQIQIHILIVYINHYVQNLHAYILQWYSCISINMLKEIHFMPINICIIHNNHLLRK